MRPGTEASAQRGFFSDLLTLLALISLLVGTAFAQTTVSPTPARLPAVCSKGNGPGCDPRALVLARNDYQKSCDLKDPGACIKLVAIDALLTDLKSPEEKQRECDRNVSASCYALGVQLVSGAGVPADPARAFALFSRSCDRGDADGCSGLGVLYQKGLGVTRDDRRAFTYFQLACRNRSAKGCRNLGVAYESGLGVTADAISADKVYRQGCNAFDAASCYRLGLLIEAGKGTAVSGKLAADLAILACNGEIPVACTHAGKLFANGVGVQEDVVIALADFVEACLLGDADGCANAGNAYAMGRGTAVDTAQAQSFYSKACKGGVSEACNGAPVKPAIAASDAVPQQQLACEHGSGIACTYLGERYANGKGVTASIRTALSYYQTACKSKLAFACTKEENLRSILAHFEKMRRLDDHIYGELKPLYDRRSRNPNTCFSVETFSKWERDRAEERIKFVSSNLDDILAMEQKIQDDEEAVHTPCLR